MLGVSRPTLTGLRPHLWGREERDRDPSLQLRSALVSPTYSRQFGAHKVRGRKQVSLRAICPVGLDYPADGCRSGLRLAHHLRHCCHEGVVDYPFNCASGTTAAPNPHGVHGHE